MKIATPVFAILLAALSVVFVRQAKRAWRDPDWEPDSTRQSPRSAVAMAILVISFAVLFAGESVFADVPGVVAKGAGGSAVGVGVLGLWFALICMATTRRFGWPRFLVPPPMRPGYEQIVPSGPAGPTVAEIQAAEVARAFGAARAAAPTFDAAEPGTAGQASADEASGPSASGADGEFIVMAGQGSHLIGVVSDAGRLLLTTRRFVLSTRRPNLLGQNRSWPVADLRGIEAGPGDTGMTLQFADGREEVFTVEKHRGLWLDRVNKLLSLPRPVTNWYGDPVRADRPVAVPDGAAVLVLWRAAGERRDRLIGYRVLLDWSQGREDQAGQAD